MSSKAARSAALVVLWLVQFLLAVFFGFVGFMKASAPMADLETYHAWVAGLPPPVARSVGWSEMLCAVALVLPGLLRRESWIRIAAAVLLVNQLIAIVFHILRGDIANSLGQNLVLIAALVLVSLGWRWLLVRPLGE